MTVKTPQVSVRVRGGVLALSTGALLGLSFGVVRPAAAQNVVRQFTVVTRAGGWSFARAASLQTAGMVGVDAIYGLNRYFGLGTTVNVSRVNTRAEDFVTTITLGNVASGDTTYFYKGGQSVNLIDAGLIGVVKLPISDRVMPYILGGAGLYGMFLDPEINRGRKSFSSLSATVGGGAAFRISERAGIQLDVRNVTFTNYDAAKLDPSQGRFGNVFFVEDFPTPPARKKTVSNFTYTLGFRYVPGGGGNVGPTVPEETP